MRYPESVKGFLLVSLGAALGACGSSSGSGGGAGPRDGGTADGSMGGDSEQGGSDSEAGSTDGGGMASDGALAGDAASVGDGGVNPNPTVSSWVGTNIAADLPRVDVTYQLSPFDTAAAQLDASGYPVAGASGKSSTDIGFVLPTGTYNLSFRGTGTLAVSGIGKLGGAWQTVNGEQRNTV